MTTDKLPKEALDLYEAPFMFDGGEVLDARQKIVFKVDYDLDQHRVSVGRHIAQALTEYWMRNKS